MSVNPNKKDLFGEAEEPRFAPVVWEDFACNIRYKLCKDREGNAVVLQRIVADRLIFNPDKLLVKFDERLPLPKGGIILTREQIEGLSSDELQRLKAALEPDRKKVEAAALADALADYATNFDEYRLEQVNACREENFRRASQRARSAVRDYIMADYDLRYFITLTLNGEDFARDDKDTVIKKLLIWLNNRVQRKGLKYIIVPELHHDGKNFHFHGFINGALELLPSGTYIPPCGGKPVKAATIEKRGFCLEDCNEVFNIPEWKYGFTTAIEVYGERAAAAQYVAKYITKNFAAGADGAKLCGRYYWHSNNLETPYYVYALGDYNLCDDGFEVENPLCRMKITSPYTEYCKNAASPER